MRRMSLRQRHRTTLSLIAILVLHWAFGIGEAAATFICLEADGHAKVELAGKRCSDHPATVSVLKKCVDLPADDSNPTDDPLPTLKLQLAELGLAAPAPALPLLLLPYSTERPQSAFFGSTDPPPQQGTTLRKTTVLLI